jgi:hypothetical protein
MKLFHVKYIHMFHVKQITHYFFNLSKICLFYKDKKTKTVKFTDLLDMSFINNVHIVIHSFTLIKYRGGDS